MSKARAAKAVKHKMPILFQKEFMWALGKLAFADPDCRDHVSNMFTKADANMAPQFLVVDCLDSIAEEFNRRADDVDDPDPGWWGCREYGEKYEAAGFTVDVDQAAVQLDPFSTEVEANGDTSW